MELKKLSSEGQEKFLSQLLLKAKEEKIEKIMVAAVIKDKDRFLLLERPKDDFMGGINELPSGNMEKGEDIDQFQVLETKVESLIQYVGSLKNEKEALVEKVHNMEKKVSDLAAEIRQLHAARDQAKARIRKLLEKIEQLGV